MTKVLYLGNQLSEHGFTPTTVEVLSKQLQNEVQIEVRSSKRNYFLRILDMWSSVLFGPKWDVILIDTYSTKAFHFAWTSARIARFRNIPYIAYIHGGNFETRLEKGGSGVYSYLEKAGAIVLPSMFLQTILDKFLSRELNVIPNNINWNLYPRNTKTDIGSIKILWVRSLQEIYNPKLAIQILKNLHAAGYEDAKLCMVGPDKDGSLKTLQEAVKTYQLSEHVEFTGRLSKEEWISRSGDFNFFINTTTIDNTPVSVIEAMALGFPVISTNVGGMPYLIQNEVDGFLVNSGDHKSFTDIIIRLKQNPNLYKKVADSARNSAKNWSWDVVKHQWLELFEQVKSRNG
ncbi:glycosyltransferase [bacterium]|nr:glycosyltransferase [bacterium]